MSENPTLPALMRALESLEHAIDSSDKITPEMCEAHFHSLKSVDSKVDRLLGYMDACKMLAAQYSEQSEALKNKAKAFEKRLDDLENYALWLINSFPDVEFRGTTRQITKKLNPPSLVCPIKKSWSSGNVIPDDQVFRVPSEFREPKVVWVLRSDALKDALKLETISVDFATLERKASISIKPKLKGDTL